MVVWGLVLKRLSIFILQSKARWNLCDQWWVPEDRVCSGTRGSHSSWDTHSIWHHAASLWVSGPEQSWGEVRGRVGQAVSVCVHVCDRQWWVMMLISWKLDSVFIVSFLGTWILLHVSMQGFNYLFFIFCWHMFVLFRTDAQIHLEKRKMTVPQKMTVTISSSKCNLNVHFLSSTIRV